MSAEGGGGDFLLQGSDGALPHSLSSPSTKNKLQHLFVLVSVLFHFYYSFGHHGHYLLRAFIYRQLSLWSWSLANVYGELLYAIFLLLTHSANGIRIFLCVSRLTAQSFSAVKKTFRPFLYVDENTTTLGTDSDGHIIFSTGLPSVVNKDTSIHGVCIYILTSTLIYKPSVLVFKCDKKKKPPCSQDSEIMSYQISFTQNQTPKKLRYRFSHISPTLFPP